jgi:hypothetical protein
VAASKDVNEVTPRHRIVHTPIAKNKILHSIALSTRDLQQDEQKPKPVEEVEKNQPYPLTTAKTFTRSLNHSLSKTERMKVYHFFSKDYDDDKKEIETQTSASMIQLRRAKQQEEEQQQRQKEREREAMFDVERWRRTERAMRMSDAPIVRQVAQPILLVQKRSQEQSSSNNTSLTSSPYAKTRSKKTPPFKIMKVSKSKVAAFNSRRADRNPGYRLFEQHERRKKHKESESGPRWRY